MEYDCGLHEEIAPEVEYLLIDDGNQVVVHFHEFGRDDVRGSYGKLGLPVLPDRRLAFEHDAMSYVRPPDAVDHHGEEVVDPSLVEEPVGPFQRGDLLGAVHSQLYVGGTAPRHSDIRMIVIAGPGARMSSFLRAPRLWTKRDDS
jgi:hypothetical protein